MPPLVRSFMNVRGLLLGCLVLTTAHACALAPLAQAAHPEPTVRVKKHDSGHVRKPAKAVPSPHTQPHARTQPHAQKKKAAPQQATISTESERTTINADVVRAIRVAEQKTKA